MEESENQILKCNFLSPNKKAFSECHLPPLLHYRAVGKTAVSLTC